MLSAAENWRVERWRLGWVAKIEVGRKMFPPMLAGEGILGGGGQRLTYGESKCNCIVPIGSIVQAANSRY